MDETALSVLNMKLEVKQSRGFCVDNQKYPWYYGWNLWLFILQTRECYNNLCKSHSNNDVRVSKSDYDLEKLYK